MPDPYPTPSLARHPELLRRLGALLAVTVLAALAVLAGPTAAQAEPKDTYVIGTDTTFAPFEFTGEDGKLQGIDMDLIQAIAEDQGFEVEIRPLGFDAALQALQSGQVDAVIAGMTVTDEREKTFDFSDPYFTGGVQLAVPEGSDISSYEGLKGQTVAVKNGTTGKEYAEENAEKYGWTVDTYQETTDVVDAVKSGHAVGYFDDYPVIQYGITQGSGFQTVGDPVLGGDFAMAVNKGENPELVDAFNTGLANLEESGKYDQIVDTYLNADGGAQQSRDVLSVAATYWPTLVRGLGLTILATVVSIVAAFVLGIVFGFGRISRIAPLRWISTAYVYVFRGTPILVQAFFVFFAIPQLFPELKMGAFVAGAITLSLNTGAYMTEIIRGGIQAVDPGQTEASRSLGLGHWKSMQKVVLPQAFRIMIPSFVNQGIITLKDTSLLSVIGLAELTYQSRQIIASTYMSSQILVIVAAMYFIVITALTLLSQRLERTYAA
ncbi:amino acid ABC transporter substrate-binding protein/permease [Brachybacterium sp. NBEC-018]|uniref:amino acid ABC transporter substrate-binding protein/permease n=1 Tax=Brachybacterium sp. NBEC-018 TaxID=2996004 RepID=UPI0021752CE0|nr:amino acid ABC transporter substrate-binding protein/permease [Brachybacterium sp. NBEC-018]UVY83888.1 amino acid ABC transporter substrate-binding protein/permease [Brachybacterium sp. NBEC-018]